MCKSFCSLSDTTEDETSDTEAILKNVTKERDELKRKLTTFSKYEDETKHTCNKY